ncbi:helix-turn-helix domain-containing protein [Sediminitomix flava]|uniref:AraC-like DNA-binding protein n=1 Tax=Sediminitomix flava TaxID=379075 RepID=A0A315ZDQ9_SEDFL|nr:helix-turn-helix domain-containing protein [Sediminitomix flava]PWJ43746.1 AraC-like DNA-binding protein [Sediminitomix flava]
MEDENEFLINVSDDNSASFFHQISHEKGGNWDGESLAFLDQNGDYQVVSFSYPNGMIVGVTSLLLKKKLRLVNKPTKSEKYVAIRIGFNGEIKNLKNREHTSEGIFMYNAAQPYEVTFPINTRLQWMVIRFPHAYFHQWNEKTAYKLKEVLQQHDQWFLYYRLTPEIEALVRETYKVSMNEDLRRIIFFARAYEIIGRILLLVEKEENELFATNVHAEDLNLMLKLKEDILSDFSSQPNLKALSEHYNMSLSKLHRTFKAVYQMPILKFFNQHRMEEANRLIKYSDKSIYEIGENLGFSSLSHFSTTFKKFFGYSPNELRS